MRGGAVMVDERGTGVVATQEWVERRLKVTETNILNSMHEQLSRIDKRLDGFETLLQTIAESQILMVDVLRQIDRRVSVLDQRVSVLDRRVSVLNRRVSVLELGKRNGNGQDPEDN